ncbi:MAG: hypothetical protein V3W34_17430 [Phycisphaerae bacterium]
MASNMRNVSSFPTWCVWLVIALLVTSCVVLPSGQCTPQDETAAPDVSGVFRYAAAEGFSLSGTIVFAQQGDTVRVLDTTYDFGTDRALQGEAQLEGNTLDIQLFPRNGDTDYRADVIFVFSDDGNEFCVAFSDTNGDRGDLGSFVGVRIID